VAEFEQPELFADYDPQMNDYAEVADMIFESEDLVLAAMRAQLYRIVNEDFRQFPVDNHFKPG
jgi:hypothetical protein